MAEEKKSVPFLLTPNEPEKPNRKNFCGIGHWNKYTRGAEYLSLTPENHPISEDELAKHNSPEDMWMALSHNGKLGVYDVTKFAEYHPGGYDLIATNAGTDASEEFRCAHSYVSVDMISRLQKGYLVRSERRKPMPNFLSPRLPMARPLPTGERIEAQTKPTWDWKTISSSTVTVEVALGLQQLHSPLPATHCLAVCSQTDGTSLLTLRVLRNRDYYLLKLRLLPIFRPDLTSLALDSSSDRSSTSRPVDEPTSLSAGRHLLNPRLTMDLRLANNTDEQPPRLQQFSALGAVLENRLLELSEVSTGEVKDFFSCRVVISRRLGNSVYRHLRLLYPANEVRVSVPLLHHVFVRVLDARGEPHTRPYTPCCVEFEPSDRQDSGETVNSLDLLVKVYELGCVSTILDKLRPDDSLQVSLPAGSMFPSVLSGSPGGHEEEGSLRPWKYIYMLAGGSGITPFLRILLHHSHFDEKDGAIPKLCLLWFNQTLDNIVLEYELSQLVSRLQPRLTVQQILSEEGAAEDLKGPNIISGRLTEDLVRSFVSPEQHSRQPDATLWMICGPRGFNTAAVGILETMKERSSNVHVLQA